MQGNAENQRPFVVWSLVTSRASSLSRPWQTPPPCTILITWYCNHTYQSAADFALSHMENSVLSSWNLFIPLLLGNTNTSSKTHLKLLCPFAINSSEHSQIELISFIIKIFLSIIYQNSKLELTTLYVVPPSVTFLLIY